MRKQVVINKKSWRKAWRMARTPDSFMADNDRSVDCGISLLFLAIKCLEQRGGVK